MNSPAETKGNLSAIDLSCAVMDIPKRPLDFTLLLHLSSALGLMHTGRGQKRTQPLSYDRVLHGINNWVRFIEPGDGVTTVSVSSSAYVNKR